MKRIYSQPMRRSILTFIISLALMLAFVSIPGQASLKRVDERSLVASPRALPLATEYSRHPSKDALKWADGELKKMSLDEKIGQLISIGINATFLNQESDAYKALLRQIEENHIGGITLFASPVYESVVLVNHLQQRAKRPLLISADF